MRMWMSRYNAYADAYVDEQYDAYVDEQVRYMWMHTWMSRYDAYVDEQT